MLGFLLDRIFGVEDEDPETVRILEEGSRRNAERIVNTDQEADWPDAREGDDDEYWDDDDDDDEWDRETDDE